MPTFETRNSKSFQPRIRLRRGYGATGYPDQTDGNQRRSYPPSPWDGLRRGERCSECASNLGVSSFTSCLDHFSPSRRSLGIGGSLIRACFGFRYSDFSPSTFLTLLCPPLLPIIRVIRARHGGARPKAKAGNPRFNSPFRFPPRRAVGRFPKFFVPPVAPACHVVGRRGDRRWKTMPRRPLANAFGVASA